MGYPTDEHGRNERGRITEGNVTYLPVEERETCIICSKPAVPGTRYCRGDRGCPA